MEKETDYICPMHPEVKQDQPGRCPKCGMDLIQASDVEKTEMIHTNEETEVTSSFLKNYKPLLIIIGLILLVTVIVGMKDAVNGIFSMQKTMAIFMSGFFLVFSGFKLLDIKGFAQGYFTYDLLAKRVFAYGYVYPFIELTLGVFYIIFFNSLLLNILTVILLAFSGIGVAIKLAKHEKFQCACLGTIFKLPLTKVTLIEDFGMAGMALLVIIIR